jgi:uncharacterized NAD(P)/FAD-binding protein YdhS
LMNASAGVSRSVVIVGGGASGVLLAAHLLRSDDLDLRVTLLERQGTYGQGLAYSALNKNHRVNVPSRGMSAFADDPDHFWRWLQERDPAKYKTPWVFVPRRLYGVYLEHVLRAAGERIPGRLLVRSEEAVALSETPNGVETTLADGTRLLSHWAAIAVGHETQPARGKGIAVRAGSDRDTPLPPDAEVMILGSGLSMVDAWVSLTEARHEGPITVVSRNGFLPQGHKEVSPLVIEEAAVPFGAPLTVLMQWFRGLIADVEATGGDWRSVVDGLRPYNQRLWGSWTARQRRQFLRHLRPWWNVHRHRLPPDLHDGLTAAIGTGQVRLVAGEFVGIERTADAVAATIRARGQKERKQIEIARVYDCGGVSVDVRASANPLVRHLVQTGAARTDELNIGFDVDANCGLIDADGRVSRRVRVVGPLTRSRFFEIEAVPDIRLQCAEIAKSLLATAPV